MAIKPRTLRFGQAAAVSMRILKLFAFAPALLTSSPRLISNNISCMTVCLEASLWRELSRRRLSTLWIKETFPTTWRTLLVCSLPMKWQGLPAKAYALICSCISCIRFSPNMSMSSAALSRTISLLLALQAAHRLTSAGSLPDSLAAAAILARISATLSARRFAGSIFSITSSPGKTVQAPPVYYPDLAGRASFPVEGVFRFFARRV